ncbi:hypothetical protein GCM10011529_25010 [Polymorphobacter glacialis]|uniref:TadE-like domain-containing protein n=1 Tax=Sandarakinorhabdus glacialis TaxID=1614636 RepID=A0A916ZX26_9SPHN|nr:TadE/TadG family type IV pilus assembly protein [Polymorphobacter glacialis]GGE17514.1 hypothetical protein GCM10011529_25010 [Polymorphobacter glacialis]
MIRTLIARLGRDCRGAAAVELALIAPMVSVLVFSAIDLGSAYAQKLDLEQAAGRAAELATAPGTVSGTYANLRQEVIAAYGRTYRAANVDNWLECNGVRASSWTAICPAGQQISRYVSVAISAEYVPHFGYGGLLHGGGENGGFITTGDAVVRIQ